MNLAFLLFSMVAFASPQGQERGGGRQSELDFVEVAQLAVKAIALSQAAGEQEFVGFNKESFSRSQETTQVSARPHLCETKIDLNTGGEKTTCLDARYIPEEAKIELSEKEWPRKSCLDRVALAVHEYGRASGNENGNYRFSSRVRSSDYILMACSGYQGDITEKCNTSVGYLKHALEGLVSEFRKGETKNSKNRAALLVEFENSMEAWRNVNPVKCDESANYYCLDTCTRVLGASCFGVCRKR